MDTGGAAELSPARGAGAGDGPAGGGSVVSKGVLCCCSLMLLLWGGSLPSLVLVF